MSRDLLDSVNLPRRNGELVFDAPWEGRSFGLALAMHERGVFEWEEFRRQLIRSIAEDPDGDYYERWLHALERVLMHKGIVTQSEFAGRIAEHARGEREIEY